MQTRIAIAGLSLSLLAACASVPQPLQGQFQPITPQQATAVEHVGAMVRWGGRIIRTRPQQDRTCFEVIGTRLAGTGRPEWASDDTQGRFIACRAGFYDPALFQPEREVSFSGRVDGTELLNVEEYSYRVPRIAADVVYLWPQRERIDVVTPPMPYWHRGWWW